MGSSKEKKQLMIKRPKLPDGKNFKRQGEGPRVSDQFVDILLIDWW